jgi:phosphonate transport system substrate-binding protein
MKKGIACVLLSAMVALGSFAAGCGGNSQEAEKKTFTIAYAPNESTTDSTDARSTLAKDLGKVINMEVKEIQASDYTAIIEALRTGKADMAYMGALAVAMGAERAGVTPIVMKAPNGDKAQAVYHSVFVTQKDNSEINSIKDFKGKTIAFVDPDSTSGNLVPTSEIMKAFPDLHLTNEKIHTNGEFFEAVSFSGKHQAGLQAVIKGDVDIVPISDQIMASEFKNGNADENAVKVVHSSAAIPAEAMVVSKTVNDDLKKTLTKFLVEYNNKDYFDKVIKKADARFVECSMEDYQPIVELNKNINVH